MSKQCLRQFEITVHNIENKIPKHTYKISANSADRAIDSVDKKVRAKYKVPIAETNYIVNQIDDNGESKTVFEVTHF